MKSNITALEFKIHEMAARIAELREIEGFSTAEMAAKTGITEAEYIECESGRLNLTFAFIYRCALVFGVDVTDIIQGSTLTREDVKEQVETYAARTVEQRRELPGLQPKRAGTILAGACILTDILERLDAPQLTISDRGLRHGLAFDLLNK